MKCFNPIKAKRDDTGSIIFTSDESQGIHEVEIPCGQCMGCRIRKAQEWATRMLHEKQFHEESIFITLTYNDENLPIDRSLQYDDVTRFIKRARKTLDKKIQYYYSGEYGEETLRPHYHMILYGTEFNEKIKYHGKENIVEHLFTNDHGNKVYTSTLLDELWGLGNCNFGSVTYDSCMYVAKYTTKKINGDLSDEHYSRFNPDTGEVWQVKKEEARMSRKPAIGYSWLAKYYKDTLRDDYIVIGNKKVTVPQYYIKKIRSDLEKSLIDPTYEHPFKDITLEDLDNLKENRENNTKPIDRIELNREYQVKLNRHKNYVSSEGTKTKVNPFDEFVMNYKKQEIEDYHFYSKEQKR